MKRVPVDADLPAMRRELRAGCPTQPGVYGMIDRSGELIYVGYSASLRNRLITYFTGDERATKERRIALQTTTLVWQEIGHALLAQLRELELIRRFLPRYNRRGRPGPRRQAWVYLTQEPAPRFRVAGQLPAKVTHSWGPLQGGRWLAGSVDVLNKALGLADCAQDTPIRYGPLIPQVAEVLSPGCLRAQTEACLAPCWGACTAAQYRTRLNEGADLLNGGRPAVLGELHQRMLDASRHRRYPAAARLRDWQETLIRLGEAVRQAANPTRRTFVYCYGARQRRLWLMLRESIAVGGCREPSDGDSTEAAVAALQTMEQPVTDDPAAAGVVNAWFRTHPEELSRTLTIDEAFARCGFAEGAQLADLHSDRLRR